MTKKIKEEVKLTTLTTQKKIPTLFKGNLFLDDRGILGINNDLNLSKIKRFYTIQNYRPNFIRAWHGHFKEEKYFMAISGTAQVLAIPIKKSKQSNNVDFDSGPNWKLYKTTLSSTVPNVFYIPGGYANGIMTLTTDTKVLVFSTTSLEDSQEDDYRIELDDNARNLFEVEER